MFSIKHPTSSTDNRTIYTYNSKAIQSYSYAYATQSIATGFIENDPSGTQFAATFTINDIEYHFSGTFTPSVQAFASNQATLTYGSEGDLTTDRDFNGLIGPDDVALMVANGPTITGPLNMPIWPGSDVTGTGTWTQN
ncbi:uncharacterized protein Triagg1_3374 [Trichoderma aggressivum f. europaeum]|uniref:Uncharacterized protein n=1 Tax=Trichoderma aggressivum f. europaeum TaxID=173218 RepID=A0AAE1IJP8_9HYPO|nr:hypothetical protein Triagg1_3374 [Trichoderma aggressivum f. europaeum]